MWAKSADADVLTHFSNSSNGSADASTALLPQMLAAQALKGAAPTK